MAQPNTRAVVARPAQYSSKSNGEQTAGMIGGAVIGAVCAGPVGLIIGGAIGACVAGNKPRPSTSGGIGVCTTEQMRRSGSPGYAGTPSTPSVASSVGVSVRVSADQLAMRDGVVFFGIVVTPLHGGAPWTVYKRYSQFYSLNSYLRRLWGNSRATEVAGALTPGRAFPKKHALGCYAGKLNMRLVKLERWLQDVLSQANAAPQWVKPLQDFLDCSQHLGPAPISASTVPVMQTSGGVQQASAPSSQPQTSAPSAQPQKVEAPKATTSQPEEQMEVEIPQGVQTGQIMGVTVPDGRQATLRVPEGYAPGSTLALLFNPATGTLSVPPKVTSAAPAPAASLSFGTRSFGTKIPEEHILQVQVPAGVVAGQLMEIQVPDGRHINVTVPAGATEGSTLQLWFEPEAGTIRVFSM